MKQPSGVFLLMLVIVALTMALPPDRHARAASPPAAGTVERAGELLEMEQATCRVYDKCAPGVVTVINKAMFTDLWGLQVFEDTRGIGSGIIWDKQGHILSNYHVVHEASAIEVILKNGDKFSAKVIGIDPDHDLAVLRISAPAEKLTSIPMGSSKNLKVGQFVLAIGSPFGRSASLSVGVISSLDRSIRSLSGLTVPGVIQTDAAINMGNSGGPLLDSRGRLIGINTAIESPSGGSVGVGFAIPVGVATEVVPQLIKYGRIKRVGLGVELVPDAIAAYYGIKGVVISRTLSDSPASKAGLRGRTGRQVGDIIIEIDGQAISSVYDLRNALGRHKEGDTVQIVYMRTGQKRRTSVTLESIE